VGTVVSRSFTYLHESRAPSSISGLISWNIANFCANRRKRIRSRKSILAMLLAWLAETRIAKMGGHFTRARTCFSRPPSRERPLVLSVPLPSVSFRFSRIGGWTPGLARGTILPGPYFVCRRYLSPAIGHGVSPIAIPLRPKGVSISSNYITLNDLGRRRQKLCLFTSDRRRTRVSHRVSRWAWDERQIQVRAGTIFWKPRSLGQVGPWGPAWIMPHLQTWVLPLSFVGRRKLSAGIRKWLFHPVDLHQHRHVGFERFVIRGGRRCRTRFEGRGKWGATYRPTWGRLRGFLLGKLSGWFLHVGSCCFIKQGCRVDGHGLKSRKVFGCRGLKTTPHDDTHDLTAGAHRPWTQTGSGPT